MTHFENQADLDRLSEKELRFKLNQIFNALTGLKKSSQECSLAMSFIDEIQKALYRRISQPKP